MSALSSSHKGIELQISSGFDLDVMLDSHDCRYVNGQFESLYYV